MRQSKHAFHLFLHLLFCRHLQRTYPKITAQLYGFPYHISLCQNNKGTSQYNNCYREQIFKNLIQAFLLDVYDKTHTHFQAPIGKMSRQEELFKEFIHLLHQYCRKEREVNFYADQLCITSRYLSELVKNVTHITAKTIINQHVIREIKLELNSSNVSIQEIAFKMNFPNQSLLSRFFKKHTGITPQAFRNKE